MNRNHHHLLMWAGLAAAVLAQPVLRVQGEPGAAPEGVTWEGNYDDALAAAHGANKPLLVVFGASWCEACRKLNEQLKLPAAQKELGEVARVYVDFDANHDLARKLGIGPIPGLRVVKPSGRIVALRDGAMSAEEFAKWLGDARKAAVDPAFDTAWDSDDLSAEQVAQLVGLFGDPEAGRREEAIRKLLGHRDKAGPAVVGVLAKGSLAERLTALDLLESWQAPVDQLDPWRPESLTKERLAQLSQWALAPAVGPASAPALDERQRADARDLLGRYVQASDEMAGPLRERLARYGAALLPDIYAALKDAATDPARERLTFLRYRVVASDGLAMQWPIGIEHLASAQVKVRHSALDELANRAGPRDTGLLLELFSDPDALVRETALRLLQKVGGVSATDALTGLLADPDPNVRAAVLKSIAEAPTPQMVSKVSQYIATEKDIDLIVHAARVLSNAKSALATQTLYTLLDHASWRVRAEAAEALAKKVGYRSGGTPEQMAEFYVRMLKLLDDSDGFVASRALSALENAEGLPATEKVAKAAQTHPELTPLAIKVIGNNLKTDPKAKGYLREYLAHADPAYRATALTSLSATLGAAMADDLHRGLADADERVRIAAAVGILEQISAGMQRATGDSDAFLADYQAGKGRPKWLSDFQPDLEKNLAAKSATETIYMATALLAMGYRAQALPAVRKLAGSETGQVDLLAQVLPWLPWDDRLALFDDLKKLSRSPATFQRLAGELATASGPKVFAVLWDLLGSPQADWSLAGTLEYRLRQLLWGPERAAQYAEHTQAQKAQMVSSLAKRMAAGNDLQKSMGLVLMLEVDEDAALGVTRKLLADSSASPALRHDALQIQANQLPQADAEEMAGGYLDSKDPALREVALEVLTGDNQALHYLNGAIYLSNSRSYYSTAAPIHPAPPNKLTIEQARALLGDKDPRIAAIGGYLLALMKDRSGLEKLLDYYHKNAADHDFVCRLVYRAVSALDDDSYTPLLTEIYKTLAKSSSSELREFYWTIRSMTGDKCMELRKHIRDEAGADILR